MPEGSSRPTLRHGLPLLVYAYLFFFSITGMGAGMKASFKTGLKHFLHENAGSFNELVSFVIGILGTSLVQSSSTVTSMAVVMTQDGIVPLLIAIGIVHGANLGTSVTSSLVAFAAKAQPMSGNPIRDLRSLLVDRRRPGFHRAVTTAIVHGMFNAIMVTLILLVLEIPFGVIAKVSAFTASKVAGSLAAGGRLLDVLSFLSPSTYTKPVAETLLGWGLPGWGMVILSFALLFMALRGFSKHMGALLLFGTDRLDVDEVGRKLLGRTPVDTFLRGLLLTILVQSSSATTSMVVPLAGLGLFSLRQVFPFIMGANIGTTTTALLAASAGIGQPGFEAGMTIAFSHFFLNTLAVVLVVAIPPLQTSILGATRWLADMAVQFPATIALYLLVLAVGIPGVVYALPFEVALMVLGALVGVMLVGPHLYLRSKGGSLEPPDEQEHVLLA